MRFAIRHIAIYFLAALMIMATGGISIYKHFCSCAGESSASIFLEASCKHNVSPVDGSSCHMEETPFCCTEKNAKNTSKDCEHDDCCQDSETFLKISDNYTISLEKLSLKFIVSLIQVLTGYNLLAEPQAFISPLSEFNDTSPPLYGRELITHLHQLKIDHFLV